MRFIWPVQTSVTEAVAFWLIRPDPNQSQFITQRVMATLYSTTCSPAGQEKNLLRKATLSYRGEAANPTSEFRNPKEQRSKRCAQNAMLLERKDLMRTG